MNASHYVRSLDLYTAIDRVSYESEGVKYLREAFISPVDKLLVVHFNAKQKKSINISRTLKR